MIVLCHTNVANTAMLASSGFDEVTSPAHLPRQIQYMVVWVVLHILVVILWCNHRRGGGYATKSEIVRRYTQTKSKDLMNDSQA